MSVYGGPDIITDGLVLHLDAANRKSYPGSGSTWNDLVGNHNIDLSANTLSSLTHRYNNQGIFSFLNNNYCNFTYNEGYADGHSLLVAFYPRWSPDWYRTIISKGDGGSFNVRFIPGGLEVLYKVSGGGNVNGYYNDIQANNWYILQTSIDGISSNSRGMFYINGNRYANKYKGQTGYNGGYLSGTSTNISIGAWSNGNAPLAMYLGMVLIYDRHLTHEETLNNYNAIKGRYGLT